VVFFLDIRIEGEGYDRSDLTLPGQQGTLLTDVIAAGEQFIARFIVSLRPSFLPGPGSVSELLP